MSRRIAFWILAAAAVLTASAARADRECFENSCRMPAVAEPPQRVNDQPSPSSDRDVAAKAEARGAPVAPRGLKSGTMIGAAPSPGGMHPRMMIEEAQRKPYAPPPNGDMSPPRREFARIAPARTTTTGTVVREMPIQSHHSRSRGRHVIVTGTSYPVAGFVAPDLVDDAAPAAADAIDEPAAVYTDEGYVTGFSDSSWRVCQTDRRGSGFRYCGPYSYRPYGAYGYRPYGSYRAYRAEPAYVAVPNAKIISIEPRN
jgi:hypothetical protein